MSSLARLNRPEYVLSPAAVVRRLRPRRADWRDPSQLAEARLPWGETITVFRDEIGRSILFSGIFDVAATEAMYRLLDPGDTAVDVGANVGYLTSLMATRVGPGGSVDAYEPHPDLFAVLRANAARLDADPATGSVVAHQRALSSSSGSGTLAVSSNFADNMGLAHLANGDAGGIEVRLARLDDAMQGRRIGLLKLDIEGHEYEALLGAETLLAGRRIRDVVFEDHGIYPTPAMTLLEGHGMTVFTLKHTLVGPRVHPVSEGPAPPGWPGPNYLATQDPDRALARLTVRGWASLRPRSARWSG